MNVKASPARMVQNVSMALEPLHAGADQVTLVHSVTEVSKYHIYYIFEKPICGY